MKKLLLLAPAAMVFFTLGIVLSCAVDDEDDDNDEDDSYDDDDGNQTDEVWTDTGTGLMWQNGDSVGGEEFTLQQALDHCQSLEWGSYSDWRLPTISELRGLIRGCADTVTGGFCDVSDSCANHNDCWTDPCNGCEDYDGPAAGGLYWPLELTGNCCFYWSATLMEPDLVSAWNVHFDGGLIGTDGLSFHLSARCVRN